jgi:hypothetical protein
MTAKMPTGYRWTSKCELTDKKGEKVLLPDALEKLDDIDFNKPAYILTDGYRTHINHDLLLLALSAQKYPTVVESLAREIRKNLSEKP